MKWHKGTIGAAMLAIGFIGRALPASAQTFDSYRCADGTHFILAFYPGDKRAFLQIDGGTVTLNKSLASPGRRYSGGGVNLVMTATGIRLKHARRPSTACEL